MNVRTDFPVVLRIEWDEDAGCISDKLQSLLTEYPVDAIHEFSVERTTCWAVSFGETAWQTMVDPAESIFFLTHETVSASLDANWRRYPDLTELVAVMAGRHILREFGSSSVRCDLLAEREYHWSLSTFEESYERVQVGRILLKPSWQFPDPDGTTIILTINPSMGFGTGHHPSTRLALSLLQRVGCEGRDVLDVGTGSGVLAMAAARLGAAHICAIDRDPNAVTAATDGLRRNRLSNRVELMRADIEHDFIGEFDLVLANLEAAQIQAHADPLMRHVRPGGQLLLSGFLEAESELVWAALPRPSDLIEYEIGWAAAVIDRPLF